MIVILIKIDWEIYQPSEEFPFHLLEGEKFHADKASSGHYEIDGEQLINAFERRGCDNTAHLLRRIWSVNLQDGAEIRFGIMEEHCIPLPTAPLLH